MAEGNPVEEALRALLARRDAKGAAGLLHREYGGTVERLVRSLPTREQAEDLSQEIWIAAQQSVLDYRFECPPRAWLVRVAKNTIADFWRRRSRQFDHYEPTDPVLEGLVTRFGGPAPTNESVMDRARRVSSLRDAIAGLEPLEREILWDRFVLGIPPGEIVVERGLDRTPNAVSQQLHRLAERLRNALR